MRALSLLLGCLLAIVAVISLGRFRYISLCRCCGALQRSTEWQLPLARQGLFTYSSVQDTPVSLALLTNGIVTSHKHLWVFVHGSGNGVRCALGESHSLLSSVDSSEVAVLINAAHKYQETNFEAKLLTNTFHSEGTWAVRMLAACVPRRGFSDGKQFRDWLGEYSVQFDEDLALLFNRGSLSEKN